MNLLQSNIQRLSLESIGRPHGQVVVDSIRFVMLASFVISASYHFKQFTLPEDVGIVSGKKNMPFSPETEHHVISLRMKTI